MGIFFFLASKSSLSMDSQIHRFYKEANPSISKHEIPDLDSRIHEFQESMPGILTLKWLPGHASVIILWPYCGRGTNSDSKKKKESVIKERRKMLFKGKDVGGWNSYIFARVYFSIYNCITIFLFLFLNWRF